MKRALLVVVLAGLVGLLLWWTLREEAPPEPPPSLPEPKAEEMTPLERSAALHNDPWPFAEFQDDIVAVRNPAPADATETEDDVLRRNGVVFDRPITLKMKQATANEMIRELNRQLEKYGVPILWQDPGPLPDLRFDVDLEEVPLTFAIDALVRGTAGQTKYIRTTDGLAIGTEGWIIESQEIARANWAKRNLPKAGSSPELLDVLFRPDFQRASIGAVVRQVKAQTGVEIVVAPELWGKRKVITWRDEPVPVRTVCGRLNQTFGGTYRVRGARIFLYEP